MLYFAFGSNLAAEQMRERCPNHVVVGLASLQNYRLSFPRFSNRWGGGTAGLQLAHGSVVWGVLYKLTETDLAKLDEYEGFVAEGDQHNAHDREHVTLELVRPDDRSIPRKVRAWAYVARQAHPAAPSRRYLDCLLAGARHHRLPEEYIAELMLIETAEATEPPATGPEGPESPVEG